ncbi:hypothetical protein [Blastopirellula marina]|uniref:Uncharacterized protein n=1 Tax=Blastopirellula marina TaxID=124 RepID=A0A2S8FTU6_9BACT|nr:hypothetical protein [Blastopirellula marina]PQO35591.1 hypothetical protein C5Y98_13185 [Blastopirellula marina]PTL44231.1 hypothetical protein C5Y97_13195 [Blastopirellula marina]
MHFPVTLSCALVLLQAVCVAVQPVSIEQLAPHAQGLCLAEVVDIVERDERPGDGNRYLDVTLRALKASGETSNSLYIVLEYGGFPGPGPNDIPPDFLNRDTFTKGKRYWIAFASRENREKHPQGVVNFWPQGQDAEIEQVLDNAIQADVFRWSPRYDPQTKLTYGRMVDKTAQGEEPRWRIEVRKGDKVLWETVVPGTMSQRYFSWTLDEFAAVNFPGKVPPCGKILVAETAMQLPKENEFGLPAKMAYVQTAYDPETGVRLSARVARHQVSDVLWMYREYDPQTGKVEKTIRTGYQ